MTKLLFSAVVGSEAFGLARLESDIDVRGVYSASLGDTLDPFFTVTAPTYDGAGDDVYFHELSHFLKLLGKQDINAWQALCSRKCVTGVMAQGALRRIALQHILEPCEMFEKARKTAYAMMIEAERKQSGKIASIACRNLHFAQEVAQGLPGFAFQLNGLRERLVALIDHWNIDEARLIYNEIEGRQLQFLDEAGGTVFSRRAALVEYYEQYAL